MKNNKTLRYILSILGMNTLLGIGAYFVGLQFNDGKMSQAAIGGVFLAMALPNFLIGLVTRIIRHPICWQFLWIALMWTAVGIGLMLL
jgi:hypothetical protein